MEMEIIEKLQNNFQDILNKINKDYKVLIVPKIIENKAKAIESKYLRDYLFDRACLYLQTNKETILSDSRIASNVLNRCLIINYFVDRKLYVNFEELGKFFNVHHSLISFYKKKHKREIQKDEYSEQYDTLKAYLDMK